MSGEAGRGSPRGNDPLVTVIIPTFNRPELLLRAVDSVRAQTFRDFEALVINDGGAPAEAALSTRGDPRMTYVRTGRNRERSAARNLGLRLARGKYIAYLDDDDVFLPEHLESLLGVLVGGDVQVAYSDARRVREEKRGEGYSVTGTDVPYSVDYDAAQILLTNFIPMPCVMHERACTDAVGGFDESLHVLEDWDLWIRMSLRFRFRHLARVTCEFTWRTDGTTTSSREQALFAQVEALLFARHAAAIRANPRAREALYQHRRRPLLEMHASGRTDASIAGLLDLAQEDSGYAAPLFDAGVMLFAAGRHAEAMAAFEGALGRDPLHLEARIRLAALVLERGEAQRAFSILEPALAARPRDADGLVLAGDIASALGRPEDAKTLWESAERVAGGSDRARLRLAKLKAR
jgi:hypothetical protein